MTSASIGKTAHDYVDVQRRLAVRLESVYRTLRRQYVRDADAVERYDVSAEVSEEDDGDQHEGYEVRAENAEVDPRKLRAGTVGDKTLWFGLAGRLMADGIEPETFMSVVFRAGQQLRRPLMPRQVASDWAFKQYHDHVAVTRRTIASALQAQAQTAKTHITIVGQRIKTREQCWLIVLSDPTLAMSALFRYCILFAQVPELSVGWQRRYRRAAEGYLAEATRQYLIAPALYDEEWKSILPSNFRRVAQATHVTEIARNLNDG